MTLDILQMLYVVRDGKVRWQSRRAKAMAAREVPRLVEQVKQLKGRLNETDEELAVALAHNDTTCRVVPERDRLVAVLSNFRAELSHDGRIGRTLLTGALPATANVVRNELITRIDKVLNGGEKPC